MLYNILFFLYLDARTEDGIATVTAKIWYVSDFHGKYTKKTWNRKDRTITEIEQFETIPKDIRNSWAEDTPHNRA